MSFISTGILLGGDGTSEAEEISLETQEAKRARTEREANQGAGLFNQLQANKVSTNREEEP